MNTVGIRLYGGWNNVDPLKKRCRINSLQSQASCFRFDRFYWMWGRFNTLFVATMLLDTTAVKATSDGLERKWEKKTCITNLLHTWDCRIKNLGSRLPLLDDLIVQLCRFLRSSIQLCNVTHLSSELYGRLCFTNAVKAYYGDWPNDAEFRFDFFCSGVVVLLEKLPTQLWTMARGKIET